MTTFLIRLLVVPTRYCQQYHVELHHTDEVRLYSPSMIELIYAMQSSATALRPALVAAHQVLWQVWNLYAFGHTPMEQP